MKDIYKCDMHDSLKIEIINWKNIILILHRLKEYYKKM